MSKYCTDCKRPINPKYWFTRCYQCNEKRALKLAEEINEQKQTKNTYL